MKLRATVAAMLMALPVAALAQTIPVPISDSAETRQISVVVTPGIQSMAQVPSARLRRLRSQMHDGIDIPEAGLRELADLGDGLAAQRYARRLLGQPDANPSDIAYYAAIAVGTGRVWTVPDMIAAMRRLDPATEPRARIRKYIDVLYAHAWAGNTLALDAVRAFNGEGTLFGPMSDRTRQKVLAQSARNRDGRIELQLALALLEQGSAMSTADRAQARTYLEQAAGADSLASKTTARNLLLIMEAEAIQN